VFPVPDPGKLVPEKVHDFLVKVFFSVAIRFFTDVLCEFFLLLAQDAAVHHDKQSVATAHGGRCCWPRFPKNIYDKHGILRIFLFVYYSHMY
jgi:hypothetical protein